MRGKRWECEARQCSDQKVCDRCGLVWDMNDTDPPDCRPIEETRREKGPNRLAKLRVELDLPTVTP